MQPYFPCEVVCEYICVQVEDNTRLFHVAGALDMPRIKRQKSEKVGEVGSGTNV